MERSAKKQVLFFLNNNFLSTLTTGIIRQLVDVNALQPHHVDDDGEGTIDVPDANKMHRLAETTKIVSSTSCCNISN